MTVKRMMEWTLVFIFAGLMAFGAWTFGNELEVTNKRLKQVSMPAVIQVEKPNILTGIVRIEVHDGDRHGLGSGVIVAHRDEWYYVVTAAHVTDGSMCFIGDEQTKFEVLYEDFKKDIAVGRFRDWQKRRVFSLATARLGEPSRIHGWYGWYDEFGNVLSPTRIMFQGHVSCTNWKGLITTDSGVHPGCSGGPLLNARDQVLGITSCVPGWGMAPNPTVGICIPSSEIQRVLDKVLGE